MSDRQATGDVERIAALIVELRRALRRANVRFTAPSPATGSGERSATGSATPASARVRTPAQLEVLRFLGSHPGVGTNAIASALRLSPNTVSALCSALAKDGAIRRERDPEDGRAVRFFLDAESRSRREEKIDRRVEVLDIALGTLDEPERETVLRALPALEQLAEALDCIATTPTDPMASEDDGSPRTGRQVPEGGAV